MGKQKDFRYTVSPNLLERIKEITRLLTEFKLMRLNKPMLAEMIQLAVSRSAYSSTSIEGNPLPLTTVKRLLKGRPQRIRDSEREILNYNDVLLWLNHNIDEGGLVFDLKLILEIHKRSMKGLLPPIQCGKLRKAPVFVNDPKMRKTVYWPPDHNDVPRLMEELIKFIKKNIGRMDPLILAGIFHRQFVIIHPFLDGNGRTVRLVTKVLLAKMGLNFLHIFSFENYYNNNVTKYFQEVGLRGDYYDLAKKVDFTSWLEYFAEGIIDELFRVKKELESKRSPEFELNDDQKKIVEYLQGHGFIRDRDYAQFSSRAKATRALDFKKLIDMELLEKHGKGPAVFYKLKVRE